MSPGSSRAADRWAYATSAVVSIGVALRLVQWAGRPSLWGDELSVARNLIERPLLDLLTRGLDYQQVAPTGYLLASKLCVMVFGSGELALRIVPMLGSVLALVISWRLVRHLLDPAGSFVASAGFALNPLLISFAAAVKQYSTDVLATVLIFAAFKYLWEGKGDSRRRTLVGMAAGAIGFLSLPSALVAPAALMVLSWRAIASGSLRELSARRSALAPIVAWAVVAGAAGASALALLSTDLGQSMDEWWASHGAFAPPFLQYPSWGAERWATEIFPGMFFRPYLGSVGGVESTLSDWAGALFPAAPFLAVLALVPLWLVCRPGWRTVALIPFALSLAAATLGAYPLHVRTSAYLIPCVLLAIGATAAGAARLADRLGAWLQPFAPVAFAVLFAVILVDQHPVYVVSRDREGVQELARRRLPGDAVFIKGGMGHALWYYGRRFGGLDGAISSIGSELDTEMEALNGFRGQQTLWVLFTHTTNRDLFLCYLGAIGRETERYVFPGVRRQNPVTLHRYSLADSSRWRAVDAERFPSADNAFDGESPRCARQEWQ